PPARAPPGQGRALDLHDLLLLGLEQLVDPGNVLVRQLLDLIELAARLVFTHLVRLLPPLDVLVRLLARVPHRHPALLRHLVEQPHHLPPPLLRQRRDRDPDDVPVVHGVQAELRAPARLPDRADQPLVPRLHHQHPRLRCAHRTDLVDRHLAPVRLDADRVQKSGRRLPGPHGRKLAPRRFYGPLHPFARFVNRRHGPLPSEHRRRQPLPAPKKYGCRPQDTSVPTASPRIAAPTAPGRPMLSTMIGNLLSRQSEIAAASITPSSRVTTWR